MTQLIIILLLAEQKDILDSLNILMFSTTNVLFNSILLEKGSRLLTLETIEEKNEVMLIIINIR